MADGRFRVEFDDEAVADLKSPEMVKYVGAVRDEIERQLRHEPTKETRNRKRLAPNSTAEWEVRKPPLRILYDVEEDERVVTIRAIVLKERERTYRGGKEYDLHA